MKARGFSLIELMVVLAIIAILAAIAYPSYIDSVIRTKRGEARACLIEQAQYLERFYTTNLRYDQDTGGVANTLPNFGCANDLQGDYLFQLPVATLAARAYVINAVPQGRQATQDTLCATLSINQAGTKTESGTGDVDSCWL